MNVVKALTEVAGARAVTTGEDGATSILQTSAFITT